MSNQNLVLWDQAFVTDPSAVKPITGKSYRGNSPKPYYLIQRATEIFGPVGIGWGVTVKSEKFVPMPEDNMLHVATVSVWYVWDGKRSETFDQMGGTKACYRTSKGSLMVDEDAGKKSVTDGMVKCLSMIGFAGDIFSGMWDDSKYIEWAGQETERRQGVVTGARDGIGEDLPQDWKDYLSTLANDVTQLVANKEVAEAKAKIAEAALEPDQHVYMVNKLSTKIRNELKNG